MIEYIVIILIVIVLIFCICKKRKISENFTDKSQVYENFTEKPKEYVIDENSKVFNKISKTNYIDNTRHNLLLNISQGELYKDILNLKLLEEINYKDSEIQSFIKNIHPSLVLNLRFNSKKKVNTLNNNNLFIKYEIKNENNKILYENYAIFPKKVNNFKAIKKNYLEDFNNIAFERPNNIDGADGYNLVLNSNGNPVFDIRRELYLYPKKYVIDFYFISDNKKLLAEIEKSIEINISNDNEYLQEDIKNTEIIQDTKIYDNNDIDTSDNYLGNTFIEYNLNLIKNRLKITRSVDNQEIKDYTDLMISEKKSLYNYYKLVLIVLIYVYDTSLRLNNNKDLGILNIEIENKKINNQMLDEYYSNVVENQVTSQYLKMDKLSDVQKESLEKDFVIDLGLTEEQINEREKLFDKILEIKEIKKIINNDVSGVGKMMKFLENEIKKNKIKKYSNLKNIKISLKFDYESVEPIIVKETYSLLDNLSPDQYVINLVKLIQNDFKKIFGQDRGNISNLKELLSDELKNKLDFLNRYSKKYKEELDKKVKNIDFNQYKKIHFIKEIILDFIEQINNANLNTLQELSNLNIDDYKFDKEKINYIVIDDIIGNPKYIKEGFSGIEELKKKMNKFKNKQNKKSNNKVEKFTNMSFHKHTGSGRIDFTNNLDIDNEEWYSKNKNMIRDFSYIDPDNKSDILNSLDSIEKNILKSNTTIKSMVDRYASFNPHTMNNKVEASIELADNDLNKAVSETSNMKYKNRELEQENRIKNINKSIVELEKLQNKIYDQNSDNYQSIKSMSDGQILSIENTASNNYMIHLNNNCLSYNKNEIEMKDCLGNQNQEFNIRNVNNMGEYNKILKDNKQPLVTENSDIKYPFQLVNPLLNQNSCLTMNGNSIGINQCLDSKSQRWDAFKQSKDC